MEAKVSTKENTNHFEIRTEFTNAFKQQQPILNDSRRKTTYFCGSRHVSTAR